MRGKKWKKLLTWLLCICMLMGLLPTSAFAADTQQQSQSTEISQEAKTNTSTSEATTETKEKTSEVSTEQKGEEDKTTTEAKVTTEQKTETTTETKETTETTTIKEKIKKQNAATKIATYDATEKVAKVTAAKLVVDDTTNKVWGKGIITGSGDLDEGRCWNGKTGADCKDRGYDDSSSNDIIRSFDSISYNVGTSFDMDKQAHVLKYEVTLPDDDELTLDETAMHADKISSPKIENGNKTYICEYNLEADYGGGEIENNIIVKVGNKHQGDTILPKIKAYFDNDNEDSTKVQTVDNIEKVTVTTAPMYNIVVKETNSDNPSRNIYKFDQTGQDGKTFYPENAQAYTDKKVNGYERTYGFALEMKKDTKGGIKGIELPDPDQDFTFDIDLSDTTLNGKKLAENGFTPLLYYIDKNRNGGGAVWEIPFSDPTNDQKGCLDSGTVTMKQVGTTLKVTVKGFKIDRTKFPKSNLKGTSYWTDMNKILEGIFSAYQFHVVYPYINEKGENLQEKLGTGTLNVAAEAKNMNAVSKQGTQTTTETTTEDNKATSSWSLDDPGIRQQQIYYSKRDLWTNEYTTGKKWNDGDMAAAGTKDLAFTVAYDEAKVGEAYTVDNIPVAIDQMVLFDRDALEDVEFHTASHGNGYSCKVLYAVYQGGRLDNEAMKTADLSKFTFYEKKEDVPEGKCDGVLLQYRGANTGESDLKLLAQFYANVKPNVEADKVYMITAVTNSWTANDLKADIEAGTGKQLSQLTHKEVSDWVQTKDATSFVKDKSHTPSTLDPRNNYTVPRYTNGVYDVGNDHQFNVTWADGLYIVPYTTTVTKTVAQLDENKNPMQRYNLSKGQRYADYKICSAINYGNNVKVPEDSTTTVYLEDTLPKGLTYVKGSAYWGGDYTSKFPQAGSVTGGEQVEPEVTSGENGTTILKWAIKKVKLKNGELPTLYYSCQIGDELHPEDDVEDNQNLQNKVTIQTDEDKRPIDEKVNNVDTTAISVTRSREFYIVKRGGDSLELQDDSSYEMIAANTSSNAKKDLWMFDTLPYKGNENCEQMNGAYKIKSLTMNQNAIKNANDIEIWYTHDKKYIGKTANDITSPETTVTEANGWKKASESRDGNTITFTGDGLVGAWPTAIVYKDKSLESNSVAALKLTYEAAAGAENDEFTNIWSTMSSNNTELSSAVDTDVYKRTLEGTVWFDKNQDGKIDENESKLKDVKVTLLKEDENGEYKEYKPYDETVGDAVYKSPSVTYTDDNGHYKFSGLPSGNYRVKFESSDGTNIGSYDVTKADADEDITKTSKVKETGVKKDSNGTLTSGTIEGITMPTLDEMVAKKQKTYNLPDQNLGLIIPEISVPVTKTWDDSNNRDGKRPSEVQVNLYADGEKIKSLTLNADNDWKNSFTGLPKYSEENLKKLQAIKYEVKESAVTGYESEVTGNVTDGFSVTNKHTTEKINLPVEKTWKDKDNQDGKRPTEITVYLQKDGKDTTTKLKLTAENGWKGEFEDLDKYEEGKTGEEIKYSVREEAVADYTAEPTTGSVEDGFKLTNTHTPDTINVSGTKTWDDKDDQDGKRPDKITIRLLANGTEVDHKEVTQKDNWSWKFENLDKYQNGKEITYTVTEDAVENYTSDIKDYDVTNSYTPGKVNISVTKAWDDQSNQDGKRAKEVTVRLYADGKETDQTLKLSEANNWTGSFDNLDEYKAKQKITYTVKEEGTTSGYTSKVTGDATKGYTITNTYKPETVNIFGSKTWNDANNQDGKRPEKIKIRLLADDIEVATKDVTSKDDWKWEFKDQPKYKAGKEIKYTIKEDTVKGYETTIDGYNVTNKHTPETTEISGSKTWRDNDDQDGVRPDKITIRLLANGNEVASKEVTEKDNWSYDFKNLDKYKAGEEIVYTVTEDAVKDYTSETDGNDVINTHNPGKTSVTVTKAWVDENNQDGIRPDSITVHLYADGKDTGKTITLKKSDNWVGSFTDLDAKSKGQTIKYTVKEDKVAGYETDITGDATKGYVVTNKHTPEVTEVSGSKTWDDKDNQDGKRPDKITIRLLANGDEVANKEVTEKDNWSYNFTNLPKNEDGKAIVYTITEDAVADYATTINGYDVTNSYTPGKISVTVTKSWSDKNNKYKKRPGKVTVHLYADGVDTGKKLTLTKATNWSGSFTDLDQYKAGTKINYTIKEDKVTNYTDKITGDACTGYVVTNTYKPNKPGIPDDEGLQDKDRNNSSSDSDSSSSSESSSSSSKFRNGKDAGTNKSAKTGDTNAMLPCMIACIASFGTAITLILRRRKSNK